MTPFGRTLAEFQTQFLCANSSLAKGLVERAKRTLQNRLVTQLRLADKFDMDIAHTILPSFVERHKAWFALVPVRSDILHRPLNPALDRAPETLCLRGQRRLSRKLTTTCNRRKLTLKDNNPARGMTGAHVDVVECADPRFQVRPRGMALPFRVLDPHQQRVAHAAITENKRFSGALVFIKAEQGNVHAPVVVPPSSAKRDTGGQVSEARADRRYWDRAQD